MSRPSNRTLILLPVLLLVGLSVVRRFFVEGYLVPVRVEGASMAPTLLGEHHLVVCQRCNFQFAVDTIPPLRSNVIHCPNCAGMAKEWPVGKSRLGERIVVDKLALLRSLPSRWSVVVAKLDGAKHIVKRIVGLPGERLEIRDGDLYINGSMADRPTDVSDAMAIVINDDRFRRNEGGQPISRWHVEENSPWRQIRHGFIAEAELNTNFQWLSYRHAHVITGNQDGGETWIMDDNVMNQSVTRTLNPVSNLALSGKVVVSGTGEFRIRHVIGTSTWTWDFDFAEMTVALLSEGEQVASHRLDDQQFRFHVEFIDQELRLRINDSVVIRHSATASGELRTSRPFSLGAQAINLLISDLLLARDSYITQVRQTRPDDSWQLADDEFFLLGDNSAVSEDSRHWKMPIKRRHLVGLVQRHSQKP